MLLHDPIEYRAFILNELSSLWRREYLDFLLCLFFHGRRLLLVYGQGMSYLPCGSHFEQSAEGDYEQDNQLDFLLHSHSVIYQIAFDRIALALNSRQTLIQFPSAVGSQNFSLFVQYIHLNKQIFNSIIMDRNSSKNWKPTISASSNEKEYIGKFQEAPTFMKDNHHIETGYRIGFKTKQVFKSLFMIHNETVNIWTHLLGAIIVFFFIFQGIAYEMEQSHFFGRMLVQNSIQPYKQAASTLNPLDICKILNEELQPGQQPFQFTPIQPESSNNEEGLSSTKQSVVFDNSISTWPIMVALIGGSICLSFSAVFHWIHPINQKIYKLSLSFDFAGIGMNMAFSPVPAFYYTFYCDKTTAYTYLVIIITAGTISFISNIFQWMRRKENKLLRFSILASSSIVCVIGLAHIIINQWNFNNYGDTYSIKPALYFFIPTLLCYLFGFIFYLSRCPQRMHPGRYDICGHSHQIWHTFVFMAIVFTYLGSIISFEMRSLNGVCPASIEAHFK